MGDGKEILKFEGGEEIKPCTECIKIDQLGDNTTDNTTDNTIDNTTDNTTQN
jgi:hypothetical protein